MEMIMEKHQKFEIRDPMSALTHFIGFVAVIPVFICMMTMAETTIQKISFLLL